MAGGDGLDVKNCRRNVGPRAGNIRGSGSAYMIVMAIRLIEYSIGVHANYGRLVRVANPSGHERPRCPEHAL